MRSTSSKAVPVLLAATVSDAESLLDPQSVSLISVPSDGWTEDFAGLWEASSAFKTIRMSPNLSLSLPLKESYGHLVDQNGNRRIWMGPCVSLQGRTEGLEELKRPCDWPRAPDAISSP